MKNGKVKIWELSLLLALCISLCWGVRAQAQQRGLTENIIRLHVIAVSDEESEQQLKLRVRDAVLSVVSPLVESAEDAAEARQRISDSLDAIRDAALSASEGRGIKVLFGTQSYGERTSEGCTLPAGEYFSLRVLIGEALGHNWWGVIFPGLTVDTAVGGAEDAFSEEKISLVTDGDEGYVIRFKLIELLREALERDFTSPQAR